MVEPTGAPTTAGGAPCASADSWREAVERFVPSRLLRLIGVGDVTAATLGAHAETRATVVFADVRNFTRISESQESAETFAMLNEVFAALERSIAVHGGVVDKFLGDGVMMLFREPGDAVAAAVAIVRDLRAFNVGRAQRGAPAISMGIGVNTGIVSVGVVGTSERRETTVIGDAVNVAARVQGLTRVIGCDVLIDEATHLHLGDAALAGCRFADRLMVKGRMRPVSVYEAFDGDVAALREAKAASAARFNHATALFHLGRTADARALFEACLALAPDDAGAAYYLRRIDARLAPATLEVAGIEGGDGAFRWLPDYDTGNPRVDADHHALVAIYERLRGAVSGRDRAEIEGVLRALDAYARDHFAMEEGLMRDAGYPLVTEHLEEHALYLARLARLETRLLDPRIDVDVLHFDIELFLQDWLVAHSTKLDKHFVVYAAARARAD